MQLHEVEKNVAELNVEQGFDLIFDLLRAYGVSSASIARLRSGSYNKARTDNEVLWRDKVFYRYVDDGEEIHAAIDAARTDESIMKLRPRFLIVRNRTQIVAMDTRTSDTLDTRLAELPGYSAFFLPWAGIEKTQLETSTTPTSRPPSEWRGCTTRSSSTTRSIPQRTSTASTSSSRACCSASSPRTPGVCGRQLHQRDRLAHNAANGSDTARYLDGLFTCSTSPIRRTQVCPHTSRVRLRQRQAVLSACAQRRRSQRGPQARARQRNAGLVAINPDIFGSMMQAVMHPGERESLGMHYTSVENIMKVIRPLFLDDLQDAFDAADTKTKLPACATDHRDQVSSTQPAVPATSWSSPTRSCGSSSIASSTVCENRPKTPKRFSASPDQAGKLLRHRDR